MRWAVTTSPPSRADCLEIRELQSPGTLWACNRPVEGLIYVFTSKPFIISPHVTREPALSNGCHKLIDTDQELAILCSEFNFPHSLSCHTFYFVFACMFPVSFPCAYVRITLSSLFILFISLFSVRCFSYLFFFLRCPVSSLPSCSPFLYLVLRSFCPFPHPLSSHRVFPFVYNSLSFTYQFCARCTGRKHELRSSLGAHVCCSQGPFSHSLLSSLTVDRASTSHKFPVC